MPRLTRFDDLADSDAALVRAPRWRAVLCTRRVVGVILLELLIACMAGYGLWVLRQQTLASELRILGSLSAAMAAQADGTLDVASAALHATRSELRDIRLAPDAPATHALLRARIASLPKFRVLAVVDAQGMRVATSREGDAAPVSVADKDFFKAAQSAASPTLFVGSPYVSRNDGRAGIGVSIDWRGQDGTFQGAIVLVADPEFLDGDFAHISPSADTSLAIYRRDRALVSDGPGDGSGRLLPAAVLDTIRADPALEAPRVVLLADGRRRLVAAHLLHRYPLMVVVSRDSDIAFAAWHRQALAVSSFVAAALLVTLYLTLRNGRETGLRRAIQHAMALEQGRALRAFHAAHEGHWEWNATTRRIHLSPRMKALLGIDGATVLTDVDSLLGAEQLHPDDIAPLQAALQAQQKVGATDFDCTFRVRHADGRWHHVRARGHAIRDALAGVDLFCGTAMDVTDEVDALRQKLALEEQLQRARKLESLGTLAGGVAHDFNNILAAVLGFAEMAHEQAEPTSRQRMHLQQILQAGRRGKALVERILSFSRGAVHVHASLRLQPVIVDALQVVQASLPVSIVLEHRLDAPEIFVRAESIMIYEAAMNLCTNGVHAMRQGGVLTVDLAAVDLPAPLPLFGTTLASGRYACLSVADTGTGIAAASIERLFEPFYTTKGPTEGTGLGLAVVHGVMTELQGAIEVWSEPGQGSRFTLYFPCVDADAAVVATLAVPATPGSGQAVLVVDDEPALVSLAEELLAELGYEAVGFDNATAALAAFTDAPDRFDAVLSDEVMPGMNGTVLATAIHKIRPEIPVVLVSGYGGPDFAARAQAAGVRIVVRKPVERAELTIALARALMTGMASSDPAWHPEPVPAKD